jgi:hypothetical protein
MDQQGLLQGYDIFNIQTGTELQRRVMVFGGGGGTMQTCQNLEINNFDNHTTSLCKYYKVRVFN